MSSIFGISPPKFEVAGNTLELDHIRYEPDAYDYGAIKHESVINSYREWTEKGDHLIYKLTILLCNYTDPETKYYEIAAFKSQLGMLWKRADGEPFHDEFGNPVMFLFSKLQEAWLNAPGYPDILYLEFISQDVVDLRQTVPASAIGETVDPTVTIAVVSSIITTTAASAPGETVDPNISIANGSYEPDPADAEADTVDPTVVIEVP